MTHVVEVCMEFAPSSYGNSLAVMTWKDHEGPTVDELAKLQWYKESLSSLQACILAVEKLHEEVHQVKENLSSSPPIQMSVSAIRGDHPSVQGR